jgi:transposase
MRRAYPDDVTDEEWVIIEPILTKQKTRRGRKPKYSKRELLDAMLYLLRTGCQWRHLPHDFPPWKSVYTQFLRWKQKGVFEELNKQLVRLARKSRGRDPEASGAIIDSQSVKTTERGALKDLMAERKLKEGRDICWLILKD